jgi:hypothetical protein
VSRSLAVAAALAGILLGGCTVKGPAYHASIENVPTLQALGPVKVSVGSVRADEKSAQELDQISARGLQIESPYADGYAGYLREALRTELASAGKLDPAAPRAVNAVLTVNRLDAGIELGVAEVAARFSLTEGGRVLYQKDHAAKHSWGSSFIGSIAAQHAINNYGATVQKLLGQLFADPELAAALRR